ncbi:hypothetical protein BIW11_07472 [Tropilaelaps mercedesae]|uniref:Uncharacterized protein n=1 Tax=Tropilaelaps mercedesae TaxID=418985 RepID=A0A1V9XTV2_9ACAR|nr:hypothetical protein BIW11_07472 [Tropilaelaps mercedesae]
MEYWDVINEAIARLRGRKNRPDVDNILSVLNKKKPTISKNVLENALNQLEKHNKLYRVYYKGHTSYRQTAFKDSGCNGDDKQVNQNGSFSSDTEEDTEDKSEAFGRPIADEDMSQDTVVTPSALDEVLQDRSQSVLSSDSDSVQERAGMCRKRQRSTDVKDSDRLAMSMKSRPISLPLAAARVSSRKRIKKTHGPDWQTDVLHLECKVQLSTCAVCRSKDVSGNLLSCSACKVHVHARCLQLTERSVAKISANKQFYCLRCKPCKLCHYALEVSERDRGQAALSLASIMEGGDMIHCCQCYSVFHLGCLRPALPAKPKGQPWMCRKCSYEANKKEKLKANAAATVMLMVAQQRPLLPEKPDRAPLTEKDKEQQGDSQASRDDDSASPPGVDAANNENSLRDVHTHSTKSMAHSTASGNAVHGSTNGSLHSNGATAMGAPPRADVPGPPPAPPRRPIPSEKPSQQVTNAGISANTTGKDGVNGAATNGTSSATATISITATSTSAKTNRAAGCSQSPGNGQTTNNSLLCSSGGISIIRGQSKSAPSSAASDATATKAGRVVKEEPKMSQPDRKPSELRKKLLETAPVTSSGNGTVQEETRKSEQNEDQAGKLKIEEQGRQLVYIAGKGPANTKTAAIPPLPRCELTFHIPKQLGTATTSLDGAALTTLTCSAPPAPPTVVATSTSVHHVLPAPGPVAPGPAGNLTPIMITSIPKKPEEGNASTGSKSLLSACAADNLSLTTNLPQIQLVPVSLPPPLTVATSAPSTPRPLATSSQAEPAAVAVAPSGRTAKLAQFTVHYPNVSEWSADQVAQFLAEIGYEKESKVFVEQEIDGASLLLLKRADVLSTLGLKLGPAVKIFRHISNLQEVVSP